MEKNINMTSPIKSVQLNDFFEFLDAKTVEKIKATPQETLDRISKDVINMESDIEGAKAILNSLK